MVDTGAVMNRPGEILLVSDGDAPLAYAVVILPEEDEKVASIVEYGGSRRALLDGIPIMFEKYALNGLTFDAAGWDLEMIYLLKTAGGTFGETDIPGTVKILNLERLAERIRPYIHGRIGRVESEKLSFSQNGDTYIFTDGKEELTAKGASSVHIVFGKKENDQWNVLEEGQLKDTLRKIFPLPRPWAGLNFV